MAMKIEQLKREAAGKWISIFENFGIQVPLPPGVHGPCPVCNGGVDRFRMDKNTVDGGWYCNQCVPKAGDGLGLVQNYLSVDIQAAIEKISSVLGICDKKECIQPPQKDPAIALRKVWADSKPLTGSDLVSRYLHSRKLTLRPNNVKFCPACWESDTKQSYPAMVAGIQNAKGDFIGIHRTYLDSIQKADIPSPKKLMPPKEPLSGAAIRLFEPGKLFFKPDELGVAEGIETAIAASQKFQIATWACVSSAGLESFTPPPEHRKIVIMADADSSFTGQKSAYVLANRLYKQDFIVSVLMPDKIGDWNDLL